MPTSITTDRLILRPWTEQDFFPFFEINSDPSVMEFFPKTLTKAESDAMAVEIQKRINLNGWGFWAVEEKTSRSFIGFVGLNTPSKELPFSPCFEIGWRLAKRYWGLGYATEAAEAALRFAFENLALDEIVAFTPKANKRSSAVMRRLGMLNSQDDFDHPAVDAKSHLREHVLYKISRQQWLTSKA